MDFIFQPAPSNRLGDFLKANLNGPWTHFRAAVAFVKRSGTKHIAAQLATFSKAASVEIIAGIDLRGTSQEGLQDLLEAVSPSGRVIIFHNRLPMTFHPKIYVFKSDTAADVIVGSGNLTQGGLFTNYEGSLHATLDLTDSSQVAFLKSIEDVLDRWADPTHGTSLQLDATLLAKLVVLGLVPVEALAAPETPEGSEGVVDGEAAKASEPKESPFAAHGEPQAPAVSKATPSAVAGKIAGSPATGATAGANPPPTTGFVMTLQNTDVGTGQTTAGTQRRSPEIFIPLVARDANPTFWGWPSAFVADASWTGPLDGDGRGKMDRTGVMVRLGGETFPVTMWYNSDKRDLRIRSEAIRSAGNVGDILRMEKVDPSLGYEYYVEVVPQGTTQYPVYAAHCVEPVRNSKKLYGYY